MFIAGEGCLDAERGSSADAKTILVPFFDADFEKIIISEKGCGFKRENGQFGGLVQMEGGGNLV